MSYIREGNLDETNYPLFARIKEKYGFIPNLYRAQSMRPDLLEAQAQLVTAVVIKEGALSRKQKEYVWYAQRQISARTASRLTAR